MVSQTTIASFDRGFGCDLSTNGVPTFHYYCSCVPALATHVIVTAAVADATLYGVVAAVRAPFEFSSVHFACASEPALFSLECVQFESALAAGFHVSEPALPDDACYVLV
jgi:hypothetical protein